MTHQENEQQGCFIVIAIIIGLLALSWMNTNVWNPASPAEKEYWKRKLQEPGDDPDYFPRPL